MTASARQLHSAIATFRLPCAMADEIACIARHEQRSESAVIRSLLASALKVQRKRVADEDDEFDFE